MGGIRVLREIQVRPSPSLPSQPPQPLSFFDSMWMSSAQVERLFFYALPQPISQFMDQILPKLTASLSLVLHHFYLLAGTICPSPASDAQFELVYTEGGSVTVTVSEFVGQDFLDISGDHSRNFEILRLLVPKTERSSHGGQTPPISVQITLFPNQGLCIGLAINHTACDGSSSMRFFHSWAAACRSDNPALDSIEPPLLNRSILGDYNGAFLQSMEFQVPSNALALRSFDPGLVAATFTLGKIPIEGLKKRAQAKGAEEGHPSIHISSFVVTCAYVWRCLAKVRGDGGDGDLKHAFSCAVDWRSRLKPPLPSNYFGNFLGVCVVEMMARDLTSGDGVELAAMEIGKHIDGLQGRDPREVVEAAVAWFKGSVMREWLMSVAGSPKLRVYEADFGWGKPAKVEVTSIVNMGAVCLAESKHGNGGIEIGLVLPEQEMTKFRSVFQTELLDLLIE